MTRCPSAAKYEFDAYGAYGKMRIGHAMAEGLLDWNEKALEVMYACTLCGACDVGCKRNLDLEIELSSGITQGQGGQGRRWPDARPQEDR